jgi:hypothetical protein
VGCGAQGARSGDAAVCWVVQAEPVGGPPFAEAFVVEGKQRPYPPCVSTPCGVVSALHIINLTKWSRRPSPQACPSHTAGVRTWGRSSAALLSPQSRLWPPALRSREHRRVSVREIATPHTSRWMGARLASRGSVLSLRGVVFVFSLGISGPVPGLPKDVACYH